MTAEVLAFLGGAPGPISLFEAWEEAVLACGESAMKVSKTQISWGNPLQFAVLSQPRRAAQRRTGALLATLGLGRRVEHPRILQAVEPYPGRWTHHLLLTAPEDVDGLLAAWLAEAYRFAREKQRRAGSQARLCLDVSGTQTAAARHGDGLTGDILGIL